MGPGLWRGFIVRDTDLKATPVSLRRTFVGVDILTDEIN